MIFQILKKFLTVRYKDMLIKIKKIFQFFGIGIIRYNYLNLLQKKALDRSDQHLKFLKTLGTENYHHILPLLDKSKSQLLQDIFVLTETNFMRGGYFVEIGAANGIDLSNTYLLEKFYSWKGILVEPASTFLEEIQKNRPKASIETLCVWSDSISTLDFNETKSPEYSTIDSFSNKDKHKYNRHKGRVYKVKTISINDLLEKYNSPKIIDYLSIDTEGSEYEILKNLNFEKYIFRVITVEHIYGKNRQLIHDLMAKNGYSRKFEELSLYEDWYTK